MGIRKCRCGCGRLGDDQERGIFHGKLWFIAGYHRDKFIKESRGRHRTKKADLGLFAKVPLDEKAADAILKERCFKLVIEPTLPGPYKEPEKEPDLSKMSLEEKVRYRLAEHEQTLAENKK